jgi:deoxycytidylate deaminase
MSLSKNPVFKGGFLGGFSSSLTVLFKSKDADHEEVRPPELFVFVAYYCIFTNQTQTQKACGRTAHAEGNGILDEAGHGSAYARR